MFLFSSSEPLYEPSPEKEFVAATFLQRGTASGWAACISAGLGHAIPAMPSFIIFLSRYAKASILPPGALTGSQLSRVWLDLCRMAARETPSMAGPGQRDSLLRSLSEQTSLRGVKE